MELWSYNEFSLSKSVCKKRSQSWYGLWGSLFFLVTMELLVSVLATRASWGLGNNQKLLWRSCFSLGKVGRKRRETDLPLPSSSPSNLSPPPNSFLQE
ncbi:hypothetical protein STEG23_016613, partial [Scotinomys teguina]